MAPTAPAAKPTTGLVLIGGGARAAHQVGVLEAIAQTRRDCGQGVGSALFPDITGTSGGAIHAAALACRAEAFDGAVAVLCEL